MATFWLRASPKRASGPRAPKQLPCCPKLPASSSQVRPSPGIKSPATEPSYPSVVNKTMSYCRSVASVGASQIDFLAAGLDASSGSIRQSTVLVLVHVQPSMASLMIQSGRGEHQLASIARRCTNTHAHAAVAGNRDKASRQYRRRAAAAGWGPGPVRQAST